MAEPVSAAAAFTAAGEVAASGGILFPSAAAAGSAVASSAWAWLPSASSLLTAATVASTAMTAFSLFSGGQAAGRMYDAQGQMAMLQGRQQALAYRQQGIEALDRQIKLEAQINARGFAGGLDPFSGSTDNIVENNLAQAIDEFDMSRENAAIAEGMGGFQADIYGDAAGSARRRGLMEAGGSLFKGGLQLASIYGLPGKKA